MFLSTAQLNLIEHVLVNGRTDLLAANVSTVSALVTRGIMVVDYAVKVGDISTVELTDVGQQIGRHLAWYETPPKFADIRYKTAKAKHRRQRWLNKHKVKNHE